MKGANATLAVTSVALLIIVVALWVGLLAWGVIELYEALM